ncbi:MAG: 2,3-bisphosphoglycerate-independent phosphoglycerate mutase [Deltaproteobacteria bacterium]|nr:2,3-bisphosphoglycerate-independent phosphoglycerate mutase [Deltaproteobacteria bacterium]
MKIMVILLDGIGDRSYEVLNQRTPLQAAATPNLDRLASLGSNGLFHATMPGQCLPSEIAHFLLFGYELNEFPGRGLLEAVGEGVAFDDTDVLCLAHLASVTSDKGLLTLVQKRPDMEDAELGQLFSAISHYEIHGIRFQLQQTRGNDAILIMSGQASPHVSDSDPMIPGQKIARILPISENSEPEQAGLTAQAFNAYLSHACRALTEHEVNRQRQNRNLPLANFLATQRCGRRIMQEPFDQRWGMAGMMIASGSMYAGLAHEIGLTFVRVKDGSNPGKDIRDRIRVALTDASHDFIHVHTKVPDEAAHKGDPKQKEAAIAALDSGLDELTKAAESRDDLLVVVTADHSTPSMSSLIHSGEPVPVTLVGGSIRRDEVDAFDEVRAAGGCLGLLRGQELMLTILNHADRSALLGHRLGGEERYYFPRTYEPFKLTE